MFDPADDRTQLAQAFGLAYAVISASIEMIAPMALGYWLDHYYQTSPVFVLVGVALGLGAGVWALQQLVKPKPRPKEPPSE